MGGECHHDHSVKSRCYHGYRTVISSWKGGGVKMVF